MHKRTRDELQCPAQGLTHKAKRARPGSDACRHGIAWTSMEGIMKKFKDFLYDKNDILIAVLILVVAASIIAWRMDVILQYPKQLIHNDKQIETPTVDPSKTDDTSKGDNKDDANKDGDAATGNGSGANTGSNGGDDANSGTDTQGTAELWAAGALTRDVEVDVTGNTATAAIQCLVDAGLFKDYAEYKQICTQSGLDDEKVKGGTFTFEKGSTKAAIAKKMNWS